MSSLPFYFKVYMNGFRGFLLDTRNLHDGSRLLDDKKILNQLYILTREYKSVNERTTPFPPSTTLYQNSARSYIKNYVWICWIDLP